MISSFLLSRSSLKRITNIIIGTALLLPFGSTAYAAHGSEEASTGMTILNVTQVSGAPSSHLRHSIDTWMLEATYQPGYLSFYTAPFPRTWGQTIPNGVTGNLWTITTPNNGVTYKAVSWDYVGNDNIGKHISSGAKVGPKYTMLTSLCNQGRTGACATPKEVRTSAVRWPVLIESDSVLKIYPPNVGVFTVQSTQQFAAALGTSKQEADWWITAVESESFGLEPEEIATIDEDGLVTILADKGSVEIHACIPKGCGPNKVTIIGPNHLLLGN